MQRIFLSCLLLIVAAALTSCEAPQKHIENTQDASTEDKKEQLLFVLHAKKGLLQTTPSNPKTGTLTLMESSSSIAFFTDRPNRKAGKLALEEFVQLWNQKNFHTDPPNSGLVYFADSMEKFSEVPIELSKPKLFSKKNRIMFNVRFLGEAMPEKSLTLQEPVIFIDAMEMPLRAQVE